ncbi:hypothetical protein [Dyadobacter sp. MSC1_007]|jgi:hypothetical protein|uniref:hypothetical protein n=1 Tax=Dyadobacter sp. MSC1_007 TaxID=2909264 RepID=UPI0020300DC2|nr:hypothetical protein [Dyadobacter sp. MSC1_007]
MQRWFRSREGVVSSSSGESTSWQSVPCDLTNEGSVPFHFFRLADRFQAGISGKLPANVVQKATSNPVRGDASQIFTPAVVVDDQSNDRRVCAFDVAEPECLELDILELRDQFTVLSSSTAE